MAISVELRRNSKISLQRQIFNEFRRLIESGALPPGETVVSVKEFCETHGVSRNTAALAFQRLADEGWIETRPGALARVAQHIPVALHRQVPLSLDSWVACGAEPIIAPVRPPLPRSRILSTDATQVDFRVGATAAEMVSKKALRKYTGSLIQSAEHLSIYQAPEGISELRAAIAQYVAINKGIRVQAHQIVIVSGAQEGLSILAHLFLQPGVDVWMEHPGYRGAYNLFNTYRANIHLQDVDADGMVLEGMPIDSPAIAHVTPAHQYPLGVTMPTGRRTALIDWAQASGSLIIENDYDGDFCYEYKAEPALAALAPRHVVHLGTFSKVLGPAFRLGYMICPPSLVEAIRTAKSLMNAGTSWFEQAIMAEMMTTRAFGAHLRRMRKFYKARRDALVRVLGAFGGTIHGAQGAMHVCWTLPIAAPPAATLQMRLKACGIRVYTLDEVALNHCPVRASQMLFLGFGTVSVGDIVYLHTALRGILKEMGVSGGRGPV